MAKVLPMQTASAFGHLPRVKGKVPFRTSLSRHVAKLFSKMICSGWSGLAVCPIK